MLDRLDEEATSLGKIILPGPRLAVLGSTSFWGADSRELCEAMSSNLATLAPIIAITGGMDGVGLTFGRSFAAARLAAGLPENLFHLLPRGLGPCDTGVTLDAGFDFDDRREIIGRIANVCLVIEGGPGTEHEATVASSRDIRIIPLGRSGGHAGELYSRLPCPFWALEADWLLIGNASAKIEDVTIAVRRLVQSALNSRARF